MSQPERELPTLGGLGTQYEIVRELGRGGTAVVYLGRDRELHRDVAIKVIRSTFVEDEEAMARLVREARTVAGLQHPNIVMLYGTQKLEDGSLALIMQYVPGRSLKDRIRAEGPLNCSETGKVLVDVARALTYAHKRRIVHRDIKPENIYLDDEAGVARLSDFGIARPWDADSNLTLPGMALGTPAYMSPEQIDGRQLDGRSDLYSLGLVGYEMLTGSQPWSGENLYTIIYRQKQDRLPPLDELRPDVPEHLKRAIEVSLEKSMDDRWATADDLVKQIQSGPLPSTPPPEGLLDHTRGEQKADVSEDAATIFYRRDEHGDPEQSEAPTGADGSAAAVRRPASTPRSPARRRLAGMLSVSIVALATLALWAVSQSGATPEPASVEGEQAPLPGASDADGAASPAGSGSGGPPADSLSGGEAVPGAPIPSGSGDGDAVPIPAALRAFGGDRQQAEAGEMAPNPLIVRVEDAFSAPVEGAMVVFEIESGGGFVSPDSVRSDAAGLAVTQWQLGLEPGEQTVVATAPNYVGPAARFRANVEPVETAPEVAAVALVDGGDQRGTPGVVLSSPVVVELLDEQGDPVPGVAVRVEVARGEGAVDRREAISDSAGRVSVRWTLGAADQQALRISAAGAPDPIVVRARAVAPVLPVRRAVVAGGTHTCAIIGDGTPYCWGGNDDGQLGDSAGGRRSTPGLVDGRLRLATISAGFAHTCGVAQDGTAYCWGANESGQLGDGSAAARSEPEPVSGGIRFKSVVAGVSHTCALTPVGEAYCWGGNVNGQLGDGTRAGRSTPGLVSGARRFVSLAVGWTHTCGLTSGGSAYCWGRNAHGQVGDGTGLDRMEPVPVSGVPPLVSLSAGSAHTCGVTSSGEAYCWGQNTYGQVGDGTTQNRSTPVRVRSLNAVRRIAGGGVHTCAVTGAGAAYCWGRNTYGQLGDGTTTDRATPVAVSGGGTFTSIYASGAHTCAETTASGSLCWGYNVAGQLGDGTRTNRPVPTRVLRLPR